MQRTQGTVLPAALWLVLGVGPAGAQKAGDGVNGKHACALLSPDEIKKLTGRKDVARVASKQEERPFTSNCLFFGDVDITVHIGNQTKVMFGRVRDNYGKAPPKMGYKVEPIPNLGDDAYYLTYSGKAEARAILGEIELAISLSGPLPAEPDTKTMALSLAKAAVAKLK
jgi:hypothetical protein